MKENNAKTISGRQRARVVLLILGIVLVAANLRASLTSVGPLIGEIRDSTGLSNTLAGMLTTLPLIAFAILSPLTPKIARRFGTEYTLLAGLIVLTVGIILRSGPLIGMLYLGTVIVGLAISISNVLLPSLIKREFPERIGLMTGIYSVSMTIWAGLASGLSVPIANELSLGWRGALLSWAILSVIAVVIWLPQLKSVRHSAAERKSEAVESAGRLWRSPLAWQVTLFMGMQSLVFYTTVAWLPEILHERGISVTSAGWMLSLMLFVSLPTTFIVPVLAGRLHNQRGFVIATAVVYLMGFVGLLIGGNKLVTLWIALIGFSQGSCISLAFMFFAMRAQNARQAAELSGMAQSVGYLFAALGPMLFGFLHDLTRTWTLTLFILIAVIVILLLVGLGAARNEYVISNKQEPGLLRSR